jgi:hypothetical protein
VELNKAKLHKFHLLTSGLEIVLLIGLLVFLVGLPFQLVIKQLVPNPLGTYWKEGLLGLLIAVWLLRAGLGRQRLVKEPG